MTEPIQPDPKEDGKTGDPFYYHNLVGDYSLRICGHSHSPLFADDSKEMAATLFKAQAIDQEGLITMLNPPNRDNLIHALRARQKKAAQAAATARADGAAAAGESQPPKQEQERRISPN